MLAGGLGIEPRYAASKAAVLPLDDPPKFRLNNYFIFTFYFYNFLLKLYAFY